MEDIFKQQTEWLNAWQKQQQNLTKQYATWGKELARHGVRVGAVAPGFINTEMVQSIPEPVHAKLIAEIPLRRLAEPTEIAHSVRYIIENDYFTTRTIAVGGGMQV